MNQDAINPLSRNELVILVLMTIPGIAFYGALVGYFLGWFAK
jgi:hypothetical protein